MARPNNKCRCRVCLATKGKSRIYPNRAAVTRHRRRAHPDAPPAPNWARMARERRERSKADRATLPTVRKDDTHPTLRFCTYCGQRRGPGWRFCGGCGTKLGRS